MKNPRLLSCAGPALALVLLSSPAHAAPLDATTVTLKNGMRVVLAPDSLATAVDASAWFTAGNRHERAGQAGLALLAARIAFRNGSEAPLAPLVAQGGTAGLVETPDLTSFSTTVPAGALDDALAFLAARMPGRATTAADLAFERSAIRTERARADRTPVARGMARLWAAAWAGHPYAQTRSVPSPGSDALAPAQVDAWRRARFSPAAAVLTVAGAFDADSVLDAIRRRFESAPRSAVPVTPPTAAPRPASRASERIESPARLCFVGWRGPGAGDPDAPALELLATWLGGGPQAQLSNALVRDGRLAVAAQAGFAAQKDGSLLWVLAVVPPGTDSSAVETTLLDAATSVARNAPEAFELERARRQLESGVLFGLQTARQRSQALGEAELLAGGAGAAARRLAALEKVAPDDLRRVAARVMNDAGRATVWMLPANDEGAR